MDLRLDIERRKRFAGRERDYKREGGRSPEGSRGPSREQSTEKSGKHQKKSKYVRRPLYSSDTVTPVMYEMQLLKIWNNEFQFFSLIYS